MKRFDAQNQCDRTSLTRRRFNETLLGMLPALALVRLAWVTDTLADPVGQSVKPWIQRLKTMCRDLQQQSLSPTQWQDAIEALFADVPLHEVVRAIDFERLVEGMQYPDDRAATRRVTFPDVMFPHVASADVALDEDTARGEKLRWGPKIFGLQRGRAIVPHAHNNMVSSHLVLRGQLHLRTYERLRDEDGFIVIAPSIDRVIGPGETVTMSDERDNVHWFVAESEHAFTFDVPVVDLVPGRAYPTPAQHFNMIYIDPAGETTVDGSIRARVMQPEDCLRKYGKT